MKHIGSAEGIGAPLGPKRVGGDTFPRHIGDCLILDFHEGAGTTVRDLSGNENNGSFASGAAAPAWERNRLSFDGGDYVDCGNGASLSLSTAFTVVGVSTTRDTGLTNTIVAKNPTDSSYPNYRIILTTAFEAQFRDTGGSFRTTSGGTVTADTSYCTIGVWDSIFLRVYSNGSLKDSDDFSGNVPKTDTSWKVYVGCMRTSVDLLDGVVSFIRINASTFSAPQVLQEYLFNKWRN